MTQTLFYSIAGGMMLVLSTGRADQIAWKFVRLVGILAFALTTAAVAWSINEHGLSFAMEWRTGATAAAALSAFASAGIVFLAPFAQTNPRLLRTICATAGIAGLAACGCASLAELTPPANAHAITVQPSIPLLAMIVAGQILGAMLLGSITVAWLLGHAYLTATKMTIAPLRHFSRMLSWSIAARAAFVVASLLAAWRFGGASGAVLTQLSHWWLIACLRIGVGLVAVGVFAWMVADCVRLRSTQSATGILYFGSVMAYVGELAGQQLVRELGWPM